MKKKLVALAAAVATLALSAVMLAGCSGGGDAQSADSAATDGSFTLAVGFDQGYPPYGYVGDDVRTVDVTVRRLREKIEDDPASPALILTRRGVGYYFAGQYRHRAGAR